MQEFLIIFTRSVELHIKFTRSVKSGDNVCYFPTFPNQRRRRVSSTDWIFFNLLISRVLACVETTLSETERVVRSSSKNSRFVRSARELATNLILTKGIVSHAIFRYYHRRIFRIDLTLAFRII